MKNLIWIIAWISTMQWASAQIISSGMSIPGTDSCDILIKKFMIDKTIQGATFALAKNGKLIYSKGFGYADEAKIEPTQPHHLFRIASISKAITVTAILKLVEDKKIKLDDTVFGSEGILGYDSYYDSEIDANTKDSLIYDITVLHLLNHTAGWDSSLNCNLPNPVSPYAFNLNTCDPIAFPLHVTKELGEANPVSERALIKFLLRKGLNYVPGSITAYSNVGFLVLGEIIEKVTGLTYEDYVKTNILLPFGMYDMHLGKTLKADKMEREGEYIDNGSGLSCYGDFTIVPAQYGAYNIEAMGAHGGWIATARDLVMFLVVNPDVSGYGGSLPGTGSFLKREKIGDDVYTWALIYNKRYQEGMDQLVNDCINQVGGLTIDASYNLFETTSQHARDLDIVQDADSEAQLNWINSSSNQLIIVAREGKKVDGFPEDNIDYNADAIFGSGDVLGTDNYVVYKGSGSQVEVTGLNPDSVYYFRLVEYTNSSATGDSTLYRLGNNPKANSQISCPEIVTLSTTISEFTYKANTLLVVSTATTNDVHFQAGKGIELSPGFETQSGRVMRAVIGSVTCPGSSGSSARISSGSTLEEEESINDPSSITHKVYPNSFTQTTTFEYSVLEDETPVLIEIYNLQGMKVDKIVEEDKSAGRHSALFDAGNLPRGIYLYKIHVGKETNEGKILLIR